MTSICDERRARARCTCDAPFPRPSHRGVTLFTAERNGTAMSHIAHAVGPAHMMAHAHPSRVLLRSLVIGLTAFLTVVDLFATQAILPTGGPPGGRAGDCRPIRLP